MSIISETGYIFFTPRFGICQVFFDIASFHELCRKNPMTVSPAAIVSTALTFSAGWCKLFSRLKNTKWICT